MGLGEESRFSICHLTFFIWPFTAAGSTGSEFKL